MASLLKQSTVATIVIGPFVDKTDAVTPETAITIAQTYVKLSKNGGAFAQAANATNAAHTQSGYYTKTLRAADTDTLGRLNLTVTTTATALPVWHEYMVIPANIYDSLVAGSDLINVNLTSIANSTVSTSSAQLGVNVVAMNAAVITSTVINANAIGAAEIASGAITSAKFAAAAITSTVINTAAIGAAQIASAAINSTKINTGAITSAKIAADAFNATGISATAVAEIQSGLATAAALDVVDNFLDTEIAAILAAVDTEVAAILADTGTDGVVIAPGAIAAATFSAGAIDAAAIAANAIGASELAQDAAREIADEVLDRDLAGGGSGNTRNVRNALRTLRNKVTVTATTLTVTQEDDSTQAWAAAVTKTAGNPISEIDPA